MSVEDPCTRKDVERGCLRSAGRQVDKGVAALPAPSLQAVQCSTFTWKIVSKRPSRPTPTSPLPVASGIARIKQLRKCRPRFGRAEWTKISNPPQFRAKNRSQPDKADISMRDFMCPPQRSKPILAGSSISPPAICPQRAPISRAHIFQRKRRYAILRASQMEPQINSAQRTQPATMTQPILKDETSAVTAAASEVHRALGPGFLPNVYHEAMQIELKARGIPFEVEKPVVIKYKGQCLTRKYYPDLICFGQIIVELKVLNLLTGMHGAQLLNYLKATGLHVGLIFNFGSHGKLECKRLVSERPQSSPKRSPTPLNPQPAQRPSQRPVPASSPGTASQRQTLRPGAEVPDRLTDRSE